MVLHSNGRAGQGREFGGVIAVVDVANSVMTIVQCLALWPYSAFVLLNFRGKVRNAI